MTESKIEEEAVNIIRINAIVLMFMTTIDVMHLEHLQILSTIHSIDLIIFISKANFSFNWSLPPNSPMIIVGEHFLR